jgi:hypothetical protein
VKRVLKVWAILIVSTSMMSGRVEASKMFIIAGIGNLPCSEWTKQRRGNEQFRNAQLETWLAGFLTGIGYEGKSAGIDPLDGSDWDDVNRWMDSFCQAHPEEPVASAGEAWLLAHFSGAGQ